MKTLLEICDNEKENRIEIGGDIMEGQELEEKIQEAVSHILNKRLPGAEGILAASMKYFYDSIPREELKNKFCDLLQEYTDSIQKPIKKKKSETVIEWPIALNNNIKS